MKRITHRRSQHREVVLETAQEQVAEHLRLIYKELLWATKHLQALYELVKPDEAPEIENPNQLKIFEEDGI